MLDIVLQKLSDVHFIAGLLASIGCAATVLTVSMSYLQADTFGRRIKAVGSEREQIRLREREKLAASKSKTQLRVAPKRALKSVVESLNLSSWLGTAKAKELLARAGMRGGGAEYAFLLARLLAPIVFVALTAFYLFGISTWNPGIIAKLGVCLFSIYVGVKAPELFLNNATKKRQKAMERAYPNMLDLLLICVESGMSIEHATRKVALEIGSESIDLAEEMSLLAAEMSYLQDRRTAYENLAARTGMESMRSLTTVLIQAERYGTPLGNGLRVMSQESRDQRMNKAETKAAALPPALTVPMILFFLPGLFIVILTPAMIMVKGWH